MTAARDLRRLLVVAAAVVLVGAALFGIWHVIVGGMLHGNLRAAVFGFVLATVAGGLLAVVVRRRWFASG